MDRKRVFMKIEFLKTGLEKVKAEALIVWAFEGSEPENEYKASGGSLFAAMKLLAESGDIKGKWGERFMLHPAKSPVKRLILVGLGKRDELTEERIRQAAGNAVKFLRSLKVGHINYYLDPLVQKKIPAEAASRALVEGSILGGYAFTRYKTDAEKEKAPRDISLEKITVLSQKVPVSKSLSRAMEEGQVVALSTNFSRDMINTPGNHMTPTVMAETAKELADELGLSAKIYGRRDIEKMGMGAFLAVAQGSNQEPKFIVLEYWGAAKKEKPYVIVGKSVTFDSGGISIKPAEDMDKMKSDMSGGAASLGIIRAAALLKLPLNLVSIMAATENLPGGSAYKPGDIVKSMAGLTVNVLNTDAEGRLTLADALAYANQYKPKAIIDIATLTGACVIALGNHAMGLFGNNPQLVEELKKAAQQTSEKAWELPLWEEYSEQIKDEFADLKNTGGRGGGAITAAAFLARFTENYPWAHLDIAGVAWNDKEKPYGPKGAAGVGVRLVVQYLMDQLAARR